MIVRSMDRSDRRPSFEALKTIISRFIGLGTNQDNAHAKRRLERLSLTAASTMVARLVSIGGNLLLAPILLHYLDVQEFGIWTTITSLVVFLSFADLGIGNGVISNVALASGKDDQLGIRTTITNGYVIVVGVALFFLAAAATYRGLHTIAAPVPASESIDRSHVRRSIEVFTLLFILNIPASLIQRIQAGLQEGLSANLWQIAANLLALATLLYCVHEKSPLDSLVLVFMTAPLLVNVLNTAVFFRGVGAKIRPQLSLISWQISERLLRVGSMFFLMQIMFALVYNSDAILISYTLGSSSVPTYSLPERIMSLPVTVLSMGLIPLWPAIGEAISRGELAWVNSTLKKALWISIGISSVTGAALVIAMPTILNAWVGPGIKAPTLLLMGLAFWKVIEAASYASNAYLNGARLYRFQTLIAVTFTFIAFPTKAVSYYCFGVPGGVWAQASCYLLCMAIPIFFKLRTELALKEEA